jgi:hypothetical protein
VGVYSAAGRHKRGLRARDIAAAGFAEISAIPGLITIYCKNKKEE